jgi:hypothetical protein
LTEPRKRETRFVLCIENEDFPASLERRKVYRVMNDPETSKHGEVRVVDESGEDYLYPQEYFVPIKLPQAAEKAVLRVTWIRKLPDGLVWQAPAQLEKVTLASGFVRNVIELAWQAERLSEKPGQFRAFRFSTF